MPELPDDRQLLPEDFSAKTLNVDVHGTEIMRQVFGSGRATMLDQLQELLEAKGQHAIAEGDVVELVVGKLKGNINTTKHLMSDLGWTKCSVKWGGVDYARQLWVRPGYTVDRGTIYGPDGWSQKLGVHVNRPSIAHSYVCSNLGRCETVQYPHCGSNIGR